MKKEEVKPAKPPVVKRNVKHTFTTDETSLLHVEFRQAYANLGAVESEFEAVKAQHKAKITEAEARMETLNSQLQAGFETRTKDCVVLFRPADKKKDFYVLAEVEALSAEDFVEAVTDRKILPAVIEDMTSEDFEQDLLQAEAAFESRSEIPLWNAAGDSGKIVVGRLGKKWYSALRGNIGGQRIDERMDSEQKGVKEREDAVGTAGKRAMAWLEATLGKETAGGFVPGIVAALDGEKGKVE